MNRALVGFGILLLACSADETSGDAAGGNEPDASAAFCRPDDCAAVPRPGNPRTGGAQAEFTCARGLANSCVWTNPRCGPLPGQAGQDAGDSADAGS